MKLLFWIAAIAVMAYGQQDSLHVACANGDLDSVRNLLRTGADVNATTRIGHITPLWIAGRNGNTRILEVLLQAGANPREPNDSGTTPLMAAAMSGSVPAVELLLSRGAAIDAKDSSGYTALHFAAARNEAGVIRSLARHGAGLSATSHVTQLAVERPAYENEDFPLDAEVILHNNLPPGDRAARAALAGRRASAASIGGLTALLLAARDNHQESTRALIEAGADLNQPGTSDRTTPLLMAIVNGHFELAKLLLDAGADPNRANADGLAPLYAVIDAQWAPLGGAANPDTGNELVTYLDLMRALLEKGANPNARLAKKLWFRPTAHDQMWVGTPGSTAFWRAAQATDLPAMRLLVEHGADPTVASDEGDTPLMMAAGIGWAGNFSRNAPGPMRDAVTYCLELGLDVNAQDVTGYTALGGAAWRGDNETVKLLVAHGARLDARTHRGWSVTDMADGPSLRTTVPVPHPDTVALLLQLGAPSLTPHTDEDILGLRKRP